MKFLLLSSLPILLGGCISFSASEADRAGIRQRLRQPGTAMPRGVRRRRGPGLQLQRAPGRGHRLQVRMPQAGPGHLTQTHVTRTYLTRTPMQLYRLLQSQGFGSRKACRELVGPVGSPPTACPATIPTGNSRPMAWCWAWTARPGPTGKRSTWRCTSPPAMSAPTNPAIIPACSACCRPRCRPGACNASAGSTRTPPACCCFPTTALSSITTHRRNAWWARPIASCASIRCMTTWRGPCWPACRCGTRARRWPPGAASWSANGNWN
jgi:hypothetical protein